MVLRLEIDGWKSGIRFSSAHFLPGHTKCNVLHGHTYALHAKVWGDKDQQDFVMDFSVLKSGLKSIADQLDHHVLLPKKSNFISITDTEVIVDFDEKHYVFPVDDCVFLPLSAVTAENLAGYIFNALMHEINVPSNVKKLEIGVDEGFGQGAWMEKSIG